MLAYAYTFNMGFFNYYSSMGLALFWPRDFRKQPQRSDWLAQFFYLRSPSSPTPSAHCGLQGCSRTWQSERKSAAWRLILRRHNRHFLPVIGI
jgi:hypothetical protein